MSKADRYSAKIETDEFEVIAEKLAAELRKSIRQLENFPILSDPWFDMAEVFGRIANISDVESKLPSAKKDATLWETEEQALRYLLEDGKLNLCLRNLIEFKTGQIKARKAERGAMIDFVNECDKYEKGLGTIMRNAWLHVEVLQTTDLPALVHHIADVFEAVLDMPQVTEGLIRQGDLHQRQEVLVFYYLFGVLRHIEEIGEHRVLPILKERGVFMLAIRCLMAYGTTGLLKMHRLKATEALSLMVETEYFSTYRDQFINTSGGSTADMDVLLEFKESYLAELMSDFDSRKTIRPLIDVIDKTKRILKMK